MVPLLVGAHVFAALVVVLVLSQVGRLVAVTVDLEARWWIALVAAAIAATIDLTAVARGRMTLGLHRQTPKEVAHDPDRPWWVTPVVWGADTGMVWTTFRVSSASWLLLLTAVLGLAPWWAGAVYGLAFALPLAVNVMTGEGAPVCQVRPRRGRVITRAAQVAGVTVLLSPFVVGLA